MALFVKCKKKEMLNDFPLLFDYGRSHNGRLIELQFLHVALLKEFFGNLKKNKELKLKQKK